MKVTIRDYDQRDAADLADVFFRSVRQVALADYTAAQVGAWAPERRTGEQMHETASDGRLTLVAASERDRAVAYIDLEPDGHIDHVYCAPEAAGHGIASQLYDAIEAAARRQGISRLFTEASELARRFFERKGFALLERQDMVPRGVLGGSKVTIRPILSPSGTPRRKRVRNLGRPIPDERPNSAPVLTRRLGR